MPYLSPPTLTRSEQQCLLEVSSSHPRDHLIFSLALETGLRLSTIAGMNISGVLSQQCASSVHAALV
jgi:site-specific recombinase XerC